MSTEGTFEVSGLELPNFDGSVLGTGRQSGVLRVEGKGSDIGLMSFEFELGRSDGYVQVICIDINGSLLDGSLGHLL